MSINATSITENKELQVVERIPDWYAHLLDDLRELEYKGIVVTKWTKGQRICRDELKFNDPEYGSKRIENLAKDLKESTGEIYAQIKLFKKYPIALSDTIRKLSWMQITHTLLIDKKRTKLPIILPKGKFNIIYADPPWEYYEGGYKNQSQHYETRTVEEMYDLPIKDLMADDCVLFLWVTFPILDQVFDLIEHWGFKYSTVGFVWVKAKKDGTGHFFGLGNWTRANAELCLIATKGSIERKDASISQIIYEPVRKHSEKPEIVKEKIVQLVGDLPRTELFARKETPGWTYHGNQKLE